MKRNHGNQHVSLRRTLLAHLHSARRALAAHNPELAWLWLWNYRAAYTQAPASTRRRWRCGH